MTGDPLLNNDTHSHFQREDEESAERKSFFMSRKYDNIRKEKGDKGNKEREAIPSQVLM